MTQEKQSCRLPTFEVFLSCFAYFGTVIFAIFKAFQFGNELLLESFEFTKGWKILKRPRDIADDEWLRFLGYIRHDVYWLLAHIIISELIRFINPKKVPIGHAIIGIAYTFHRCNILLIPGIIAINLMHYVCMRFGKRCIWLITFLWLLFINIIRQYAYSDLVLDYLTIDEVYEALNVWSWLLLRTTSFAMEYNTAKTKLWNQLDLSEEFSPWKYLGYTFYLPVLQHGPPLIYQRYATMFRIEPKDRLADSVERFKKLLLAFAWIGCIYLIIELFSHFIYLNIISYNPDLMDEMASVTMYGFAFAMGQYFCCRYMVSYGFGIALTRFDRIDAPNGPKCIGRIHLYSHMWRYFDQGYYDFLFRHIYCELCSSTSSKLQRFFGNLVTFAFIYVWHGYYAFVFVWVAINLILLQLEQLQRHIFNKFQDDLKAIGDRNVQRLNAIVGSQVVLPSIVINLMFIGGPDVAICLALRTYVTGGLVNYFVLSFVAYNFYQYSSYVLQREKQLKAN